jgi:esterase/lipase superfamily enzyme
MGNYLLRKGMEYLSDFLGNPRGRLLFDETLLLAPDISSKDIEMDGKAKEIADFSRRVHVYYSKFDRALKASSAKRFGGDRLGRHGAADYDNLPGNVVVIDAKKYANSESISGYKDREQKQVSVHSSHRYHNNILSDMVQVLSSIDREQITGREPVLSDGVPMRNHYKLV